MKHLCLVILSIVLCFSCKHDHTHGENGDHSHSHATESKQAHSHHDGHDHAGHNHNHDGYNHNHDGHNHNHDGHSHDSHNHEGHNHNGHNHSASSNIHNVITPEEKAEGWVSLFDGNSIRDWRGYKEDISPKWVVDNGTLHFNPDGEGRGGDIISTKQYENFVLSLDWKIEECGNSGVFWNVVESDEFERTYHTGPEMQILDNKCHPDAKIRTHRAGDLYDMIETSQVNVKPAMQWNQITIKSKDGHYLFYQNGVKVVDFNMHTPEWDAMIEKSKFKDLDGFGKAKKGHLALQDHGDKVWFRNIKIRSI